MSEYQDRLMELDRQEAAMQFEAFTAETALEIGLGLIDKAKNEKKKITIDITRHGHQLFHYAFEGTSPDNDQWILGKIRVVNRFGRSSLYIGTLLKSLGKSMEEKYLISSFEYRAHGGSFPIILKGTGMIGTITVSGLAQEEDHAMVVDAIRTYLGK